MSYVDSNLMKGENVVYSADVHWFIYARGIGVLLVGMFVLGIEPDAGIVIMLLGVVLVAMAHIEKNNDRIGDYFKASNCQMGFY